ncbi:MAG: hypothetical protein KGR26_15680, partial [Cyanobacteria bacterium REEB65]|nr:hypothetical protein [Cyanobacteria bacterium REEB65]
AGCSVGSELYSVMLLLDRLGALDRCEFLGTDIDEAVLEQAAQGLFAPHEQKGLTPPWTSAYFEPAGDGKFKLHEQLVRRARFRRHNLLADPFPNGYHLILCRNVVIYFTAECKLQIFRQFSKALEPRGMLFVGASERIYSASEVGFRQVRPYFYQNLKER